MRINDVKIEDAYAEAFTMSVSRLIITARTPEWALHAARSAVGFATSVIMCKCEGGIERILGEDETPDARPGVSVLLFAPSGKDLEKQLVKRVGQCVMTSPTSACYNGLEGEKRVSVGGKLRFFGDGYQISKLVGKRRVWRIPVMEGEFVVEEKFGMSKGVGGGNFIVIGTESDAVRAACENAVAQMRNLPNIILPFPGGIARSGSKVGSKYAFLKASTNTAFCPTIKSQTASNLSEGESCALEIVINGIAEKDVADAMHVGIRASCLPGVTRITAADFGGTLGAFKLRLHEILGVVT